MKEEQIELINEAVISLKKKYLKYRIYPVIKPVIVYGFFILNIVCFFVSAKWISHWSLTLLTMIGFYSVVYFIFGKRLKKSELFAYLIDEPFDSISSIVHHIDSLLDEKEALQQGASEEELKLVRARSMIMTGSTTLKKRNK